jgi:hypothetical protein
VRRDTDHLDGVDPIRAFDVLLDRAVRDAVRSAGKVGWRAVSLARAIGATFAAQLPRRTATRSSALYALAGAESCAARRRWRWQPMLAAAGRSDAGLDAELDAAREAMAGPGGRVGLARDGLRRPAARCAAWATWSTAGRGRPRAARRRVRPGGARRRPGCASAAEQRRYRKPVTDLLWRVGDALRDRPGGDEAQVVGPLAAWWALSAGGLELIDLLDTSRPRRRPG